MEKASRIGKEGGGRREKSGVRQEVSKQEWPYKAKGSQTPGVKCHTKDLNPHMKEMGLESTQGGSPVPEQGNRSTSGHRRWLVSRMLQCLQKTTAIRPFKNYKLALKPLNLWSYLFLLSDNSNTSVPRDLPRILHHTAKAQAKDPQQTSFCSSLKITSNLLGFLFYFTQPIESTARETHTSYWCCLTPKGTP